MPYKDPERAREAARKRQAAYYLRYPERQQERSRRYREANHDQIREHERERYAATKQRPEPLPAVSPELPPLGQIIADDDGGRIQCHVCGRFYRRVGTHVTMTHHLSLDAYRERYALNRTASLDAPAYQDNNRQRAIKRGIGNRTISEYGPPDHRGEGVRLQGRIQRSEKQRSNHA